MALEEILFDILPLSNKLKPIDKMGPEEKFSDNLSDGFQFTHSSLKKDEISRDDMSISLHNMYTALDDHVKKIAKDMTKEYYASLMQKYRNRLEKNEKKSRKKFEPHISTLEKSLKDSYLRE